MTTIVCNREMMAADSLAVSKNRSYHTRKLFRVGRALIGTSGTADEGRMFVHWYASGADLRERPSAFSGVALVLDESGIYRYEANCYPIEVLDDEHAIGSGCDVALAALRMGRTLEEAVELACEIDFHTGPPVVVERL